MVGRQTTGGENQVGGSSSRHDAFQVAYRDHSGAVYSVARGICGPGVAADVTKEVFLHLWSHPERYGPGPGSRRSLVELTHKVAVDTVRSEARRASKSLSADGPGGDVALSRQLPDPNDGLPLPAGALDVLGDDERAAIVTVYYGGCNYREAAALLGVDEGTMKGRIREGLKTLGLAYAGPAPTPSQEIDGAVDLLEASVTDQGLAQALDARMVIAQAQGMIMEREGKSPSAAYAALSRLADRCGMTLPACAEVVVTSTHYRILDRSGRVT